MEPKEILGALRYGTALANERKRPLLFEEARDPARLRQICTAPFFSPMLADLRAAADCFLKTPVRAISYSLYRLFDETGNRARYEAAYFERRQRLVVFGSLAVVEGNRSVLDALADTVWAVCDEYAWCLPAHMNGKSLSEDGRSADGRLHSEVIDLFAAETAFALSEILSLTGDRLPPLVAARAGREIERRVLAPYRAADPPFFWEKARMNWAAVCGGSVGAAALYRIADDETLAPLVARLLRTMDFYLSGFPADGSCPEGVLYWSYGFGFFLYFSQLLRQRTGGKIDLSLDPRARKAALFLQRSSLPGGCFLSYADAPPRFHYPVGLVHGLAALYPSFRLPDPSLAASILSDGCGRWPAVIRSLFWPHADAARPVSPPEPWTFFENAQIVLCRSTAGGSAFSAKGGSNAEPHNHNDLGSFIYMAGGEPFFTDPGAGAYTRDYFGPGRYQSLAAGSQGHSVPIVEGRFQSAGQRASRLREAFCDGARCRFSVELTEAYDDPNLRLFTRTFGFDRETAVLRITDEFLFDECPLSVTERFVSFIEPQPREKGFLLCGKSARAELVCDGCAFESRATRTSFPSDPAGTLHLMDFSVLSPMKKMKIDLIIRPLF